MTARAAADGVADFLLVLNACRLRVMGAPSLAAMLLIRVSKAFTGGFAPQEFLARVGILVFFGAAARDPRLAIRTLLGRIRDSGYDFSSNFATANRHDCKFRLMVDQAGLASRCR